MVKTQICLYEKCGKEFIPPKKGTKYCCPECKAAQKLIRDREYHRNKKAVVVEKRKTRAEIEREARKLGMHYGQYVAYMNL